MTIGELLECGKLTSSSSAYQRKKRNAINVCVEQLATHDRPYVAISGGKDSVAMAFIVNEAAKIAGKDFTLWVHLSDASFPGTEEICREVSDKIGRQLDISRSERSAFESLSIEKVKSFGKEGVFFSEVKKYAKDKDLSFVGVRASESKRRKKAAEGHGMVFHSTSIGNTDVVNPLQWFSIYDVFAVLYQYDAPIHPIYYKYVTATGNNSQKEPHFIRLSYVTSRDLWEKGTLFFLKVNYPDLYAKLIMHCPDAKRFT